MVGRSAVKPRYVTFKDLYSGWPDLPSQAGAGADGGTDTDKKNGKVIETKEKEKIVV